MAKQLQIGDKAPAFSLPGPDGQTIALKQFKGQTLVLFFYPKDMTPGCTKEAVGFSEKATAFKRAGAAIVGISKDSVARHEKFIAKHDLRLLLASDEDGHACEDYGVWVKKNMYGRSFMGIERSTFVIDGKGKIRAIWRKVKVAGHVEEVLAAVKELKV